MVLFSRVRCYCLLMGLVGASLGLLRSAVSRVWNASLVISGVLEDFGISVILGSRALKFAGNSLLLFWGSSGMEGLIVFYPGWAQVIFV